MQDDDVNQKKIIRKEVEISIEPRTINILILGSDLYSSFAINQGSRKTMSIDRTTMNGIMLWRYDSVHNGNLISH